jgi:hypothetical protein
VFTWSASGNIITEALAARFPTLIVYIMDSVRSTSPVTFMSNMLYACSILYKCKLPFIVAMNKVDVVSHRYAVDWMQAVLGYPVVFGPPVRQRIWIRLRILPFSHKCVEIMPAK